MAKSSNLSGSLATYVIKINGSAVPEQFSIYSVYIEKNVNRVPTARIVVIDGNPDSGDFPASSSSTFLPGGEVTVEAGYNSANQLVFQGIITGQSLRIDQTIGSALEVECRDAAVRMTVGRKSRTFSNQKDSDIISSLISEYSGLTGNVTATSTTPATQVQYYATDWDFMLARADANGLIVTALNGKISVIKPDATTSSVLTVAYGNGLLGFNANLNSLTQLGNVSALSWDYQKQMVNSGEATSSYTGPGNLSSKTLSHVVGLSTYDLQTPAPMDNANLANWSQAQLVKSSYSKIRGTAKFQGTSLVDPSKYITLAGVGDRFNGDYLVSGVVHTLSDGNWITEVTLGLSPTWTTEEPGVMAPPASGLLPGARGLFNGTVKQTASDPGGQFRILVDVPLFEQGGAGIWARLSNFYSSNGAGAFFLPEVGDEVVVGFLNEDPCSPIILGSVYSSPQHQPPFPSGEINALKGIVTRSGISMQFDDVNKIFTLTTPGNNRVMISDRDQCITLQDQNSNTIRMNSEGISLQSPKSITIDAGQNLILRGAQGVSVQSAGGDVQTTGMNIKETAQNQYSAQGNLTAQVGWRGTRAPRCHGDDQLSASLRDKRKSKNKKTNHATSSTTYRFS